MKEILIIDDDIMTLQILKKQLEKYYDVQIENAGYRLIKKIEDYHMDLILLDIEMPIMNGKQVFEELRNIPKYQQIPVIFLTGVAEPQLVMQLMQEGAAGYLVKTAGKDEMLKKIEKVLRKFS